MNKSCRDQKVVAVIKSRNGAQFIHDTLELSDWSVEIGGAQKVKGLAASACKTDKIDARILAELSRRNLVPAIWLPGPEVREGRERARWRLHLVQHRTPLKNRIHATLTAFGQSWPVSDLFGTTDLALLGRIQLPEPWTGNVRAALRLIDAFDAEINMSEADLRRLGAKHPCVSSLMTVRAEGWILAYTIARELDDIERFLSPKKPGAALRTALGLGSSGQSAPGGVHQTLDGRSRLVERSHEEDTPSVRRCDELNELLTGTARQETSVLSASAELPIRLVTQHLPKAEQADFFGGPDPYERRGAGQQSFRNGYELERIPPAERAVPLAVPPGERHRAAVTFELDELPGGELRGARAPRRRNARKTAVHEGHRWTHPLCQRTFQSEFRTQSIPAT